MKKSPVSIDALLEPLLLDASDDQADEILLRLVTEHAEPMITPIRPKSADRAEDQCGVIR